MNQTASLKQQAQQMLQANHLQEARKLLVEINKSDVADAESWHMMSTVHGMLGEFTDSARCSRRAIELDPSLIGGYLNLGNALSELGNLDESEKYLREALRLDPTLPQAHLTLGNLLRKMNKTQEAESSYQEAISLKPDYADGYTNLAVLQQEHGNRDQALENFAKAAKLMPGNVGYQYNLACTLHEAGRLQDAVNAYSMILGNQPNHAESHNGLGIILESQGRYNQAIDHYKAALASKPDFKAARIRLTSIYGRVIPSWHFPMMNDEVRNSAYDEALRKAIKPDSIVLDIGSGSGLLAMMAARAGAKHIYTCEVKKPLADKAREIVAVNGYSDKITVINKKSTNMAVGTDMAERADILVSEILDECLLGEGVIPSVFHARKHLVKDNATIIPASATIHAALVESARMHDFYCVSNSAGFDVSAFNEFSRCNYTILRLPTFPHRIISDPVEAFRFDLSNPDPRDSGEESFTIPVNSDCTCHAVVFWFRLELDSELSLETSPYDEESCWMQAAHITNPPLELKAGDTVRVIGKYDSVSVRFMIDHGQT